MSPHAIARLLRQLEATVPKCTHLRSDSATYGFLRGLIMSDKGCDVIMRASEAADAHATARLLAEIDRAPLPA